MAFVPSGGGGSGGAPSGPASGDLSGSYPGPTLATIGSAAGPTGDGTHVPVVTIDAKGRVTALTSAAITGGTGTVTSVAAGDGSIVVGGTPTVAPTLETGSLATIASLHASAGPIAASSQKITGLANGTASTDAAAFGQIPTALPPNGSAGGDLTGSYPSPTLAAIGSATGPIGDGTHVSTVTIDAKGRVTALTATAITAGGTGTVTSVAAGDGSIVVGGTPTVAPTLETGSLATIASLHASSGAITASSQKITSLANGTASTDAAAFGQIPVQLVPTAVKTAAYNASAGDYVPCDTNATAAFTVTLPTAPADKSTIAVDLVTKGSQANLTIATGGSDVFNKASGPTTLKVSIPNETVIMQYAATPAIWYVFSNQFPAPAAKRTATITSSATPAINTDSVDFFSITALAAAITSFTTNLTGTPVPGQTLWIAITDSGTARGITWGASFEASTVALPTTTVISTRIDIGLVWNDATSKWRCVAVA